MSKRRGDWMQTYTGRQFWPLDPRPEEVAIEDIARALSMQCRFAGHCAKFYSVADHSVRVSMHAGDLDDPTFALAGLLHDAAEAYVVDVPRPLKRFLPGYKEIEREVARAIEKRFGLPVDIFEDGAIKHWDEVLLATEARDVMGGQSAGKWTLRAPPLTERVEPLDSAAAEAAFLDRFAVLTARVAP